MKVAKRMFNAIKDKSHRHVLLLKTFIFFVLILSTTLVFSFISPSVSFAEPNNEEETTDVTLEASKDEDVSSIQKDIFMGILQKKVTDGGSFFDLLTDANTKRKELNYKIAIGEDVGHVSLYDRFGGELAYNYYTGEQIIKTNAADKLYTAVQSVSQDGFKFENVVSLVLQEDSEYTNKFYQNRPELKDSNNDPRAAAYKTITPLESVGLGISNLFLKTAEFIVDLAGFLLDGSLINRIAELLTNIVSSDAWKPIQEMFDKAIIPILWIAMIVFVGRNAFVYLKQGNASLRRIIVKSLSMFVSIFIIMAMLAQPATVIGIYQKFLTIGETLTAESINQTAEDNEIIHSDNNDNVIKASLWEPAIFRPWVEATFGGTKYEELYTPTYATPDNNHKVYDVNSEAFNRIGNIGVPISANRDEDVKNWAALAYSCSSIYHLPGIKEEMPLINIEDPYSIEAWPKAQLLSGSNYIYPDDLRWVDAYLKVGELDPNGDSKLTSPYINTRQYQSKHFESAIKSLWLALLLIPVIILGFKKLVESITFICSFAVIIVRGVQNVLITSDDGYDVLPSIKKTFLTFAMYLWYVVLVTAAILLYRIVCGADNMFAYLLYLAIAIYLCNLKPKSLKENFSKIRQGVTSAAVLAKNNGLKDGFSEMLLDNGYYSGMSLKDFSKSFAKNKKQQLKDIANGKWKDKTSITEAIDKSNKKLFGGADNAKEKYYAKPNSNFNIIRADQLNYQRVKENIKKVYEAGDISEGVKRNLEGLFETSGAFAGDVRVLKSSKCSSDIDKYGQINKTLSTLRKNLHDTLDISPYQLEFGAKELNGKNIAAIIGFDPFKKASSSYYNDRNSKDDNYSRNGSEKRAAEEENKLDREYNNFLNRCKKDENLSDKEKIATIKKFNKRAKKLKKEKKLNKIQHRINSLTGSNGGEYVSLGKKLFFVKVFLFVYLIMMIFVALLGI